MSGSHFPRLDCHSGEQGLETLVAHLAALQMPAFWVIWERGRPSQAEAERREHACLSPLPTWLPWEAEVSALGPRGLASEARQMGLLSPHTPPSVYVTSLVPLSPGGHFLPQHPSCGTPTALLDGSWDRNTGF